MVQAFHDLVRARGLLRNFVVRDINVRYKGSVLGILWSLLNPLLMMIIYTIVFSKVVKVKVGSEGNYPIFFLSGFLGWSFFGACLQMGTMSLLQHGSLISKVYFPREVLPLSIVIASLVNLGISLALFVPVAIYFVGVSWIGMLVLALVIVSLALFGAGITMVLSALVVFFRDIEFLLGILLMAWFFMTPISYPRTLLDHGHLRLMLLLNPVEPFVRVFQDVLYHARVPGAGVVAVCVVLGLVSAVAGYAAFIRLQRNLAEEL